jgi:uncharacterized membrane protein YqjE
VAALRDPRAPGATASLRALGRTVAGILQTRAELLAVEVTQLHGRAGWLALLAALGLLALGVSLLLLAGLAVAWTWDTPYRLWTIAGLALLFASAAAGCAAAMVLRLRAAPAALAGTLQALAADGEALA